MKAGIYARFSSDLQSPTSIADQVRDCRARADTLGAEVVEVYADAALSGADARHRPALQRLMADARAGQNEAGTDRRVGVVAAGRFSLPPPMRVARI